MSVKGLWVQRSAEAHTEEGKGEEEATQTVLKECRKCKEVRGHESQFSEDLQTLLFGYLFIATLKESKIKDLKMIIICRL